MRYVIMGVLLALLLTGCAARVIAEAEADLADQKAWTSQMRGVVDDQVMAYRVEIARIEKDDFDAGMAMRVKLLEFMGDWRPDIIAKRALDLFRTILKPEAEAEPAT